MAIAAGESLWPFSERNGVGVAADVEVLLAPPVIQLTEDDAESVRALAADLFTGNVPDLLYDADPDGADSLHCSRTLIDLYQTSVKSLHSAYYADYFNASDGFEDAEWPETDAATLAARSLAWYKNELGGRIVLDRRQDALQKDCSVVVNYTDPDKLLEKFGGLQEYRQMYRQLRRVLKRDDESDLRTVQLVVLDLYQARVNNMTAELYPAMVDVADWLSRQPLTEMTDYWRQRLQAVAPVAGSLLEMGLRDRLERTERLAWSMDYIRNGADWQIDGSLSPISRPLEFLADELDASRGKVLAPRPRLATEDIEVMRRTRWQADDVRALLTVILEEDGLLSRHQATWEEVKQRDGAASDGKWQVVIADEPGFGSMTVESVKKVMAIPGKFNRALMQASPAGALPVSAHELDHVYQAEFDAVLARQLPLAMVRGARSITTRELGGIVEEREVLAMAGIARPTNTTYVRAMQEKVDGGNHTEVARAYAEVHSSKLADRRATAAGKNILRLYRFGTRGGHDSQALDYAEQELLLRGIQDLPAKQQLAITLAGGSFALRDLARLHEVGLVQLPDNLPVRPAWRVMDSYLELFHNKP